MRALVRLSGRNLNRIHTALAHRNAILKELSSGNEPSLKDESNDCPFGEDVKIIRQHKLNCKLLTPTEKDGVVAKYKCGMTMAAIADEYGCHYTTVGRLLRKRGIEIKA
jgi:hypothetical protein